MMNVFLMSSTSQNIISIVLMFAPFLLSILVAKRYNIIHAIITMAATIGLLLGINDLMRVLAENLESFNIHYENFNMLITPLNDHIFMPLKNLLIEMNLEFVVKTPWYYIILLIVFVVSQILSSKFRKKRLRRDRELKKALKRVR